MEIKLQMHVKTKRVHLNTYRIKRIACTTDVLTVRDKYLNKTTNFKSRE